MGKCFRTDNIDQALLLPPSLHDWVPEGHLARFLADVVAQLDLRAMYATYEEKDGRGQAAYAPAMMLRLLPRCSPQNRPTVITSKPANGPRLRHKLFYPTVSR
jgi:hypothetical protein